MAMITTQSDKSGIFPHANPPAHPAGFFSRFEAFAIDLIILAVIQLVAAAFIQTIIRFFRLANILTSLQSLLDNPYVELGSGTALMALFVIAYFTFFWTLVGFTPGKALLGLKVVQKDGKKLSFFRSLVRFFSYWISAIPLFLGFFWVLWDPKRQGWHDKIAGTQVLFIQRRALH
ncbi:MAG: hypothetical protein C3F13_14895 [Anaerolineales bacterium]|nr:RDD family protein [Anaerolineae bacterium]PWB51145.1 MAG: hypothetical protein C3F13_14895 [Anaerolineales bacterium]